MNYLLHIERLRKGETTSFRPRGNSMTGKINSGQLVTVEPAEKYEVGDMVLCKVRHNVFVHLVNAIGQDGRYQIANNHGYVNGWATGVYGKVIKVED